MKHGESNLQQKKQRSLKTLKNSLDIVFSLYILKRDTWSYGSTRVGKCISCGLVLFYEKGDCGHFISRRHMSLRWNAKNNNIQCRFCKNEGNNIGYVSGMIQKYGQGIIDELTLKKNTISKLACFELEQLINYYKSETEKLK